MDLAPPASTMRTMDNTILTSLLGAPPVQPVAGAPRRVLVLGDSIAFAGGWIAALECRWLVRWPQAGIELLDLGLPSEAAGEVDDGGDHERRHGFPNPSLGERLERVLSAVRPHAIIACYGMNDGAGLPYASGRSARYQEGIRRLHAAACRHGAAILHLTPPIYDPHAPHAGLDPAYDEVLARLSAWLLSQRDIGWQVIDLRTPMATALAHLRRGNPSATLQPDGVHPDEAGHWVMAQGVFAGLGDAAAAAAPSLAALLPAHLAGLPALVQERLEVQRDAWLRLTGHNRPNLPVGMPMHEAEVRCEMLSRRIAALLTSS